MAKKKIIKSNMLASAIKDLYFSQFKVGDLMSAYNKEGDLISAILIDISEFGFLGNNRHLDHEIPCISTIVMINMKKHNSILKKIDDKYFLLSANFPETPLLEIIQGS